MDLSYLKKFNDLPKDIKDAASAPEAVARIDELGKEYGVDLAAAVMRVMVRDIRLDALGAYLINTLGLPADQARTLEQKLRRSVFSSVIDYLLGADKGPKLVFHETDEKDARAVAPEAASASVAVDFDKEINAAVETIAAQSRINFSDPLSGGKFRQVMKTYLRGTRDKLAVSDALTKAAELGGVALSRDTAERVLIIAGNFLNKRPAAPAQPKIALPEDKIVSAVTAPAAVPSANVSARPVVHAEYDLEASLREQGKLTEAQPAKAAAPAMSNPERSEKPEKPEKPDIFKPIKLDTAHELMPPVPAVVPAAAVKASVAAKAVSRVTVEPETTTAGDIVPSVTPPRRNLIKQMLAGKPLDKSGLRKLAAVDNTVKTPNGKVLMNDIHYTQQAQSPIDELKNFNLVNFRRLDPDPVKAVDKIREKMEVLGREEYGRKIEAIVAWQQSPLNRLYLSVCRLSLDEGLALGAVLDREKKKEPNFLRSDELSAIIALNRSLKF